MGHYNDNDFYNSRTYPTGPRKGFRSPKGTVMKVILAAAIMAGLMSPAAAHAYQRTNTSETNTPTPEVTRTDRSTKERKEKLRSDDEWFFVNYDDREVVAAFRMDMESVSLSEMMVDMVSDPDMFESELDFYYEGSFRVDRDFGYCEGIEAYDPDSDLTMFLVVCADDTYVNMVMGTNEDDALEAMEQMQDGYVPDVDGYVEDEG